MATLDPQTTALVVVDPQNDFLSEVGVVWDLVGAMVEEHGVVGKLKSLVEKAQSAGVTVVYSPHYYDKEYQAWENPNFIDQLMFVLPIHVARHGCHPPSNIQTIVNFA